MAAALDRAWRGPLGGFVVVPYGHAIPAGRIAVREASHPLPDASALAAGEAMLAAARAASRSGERLICLFSGGASSIACVPPPGIALDVKRGIVGALLDAGADIRPLNTVRRHLSLLKGGRLALAAAPSPILCLAISDVPGDDPALIGSGPCSPGTTTPSDARRILAAFGIPEPEPVRRWLDSPEAATPAPGDPRLSPLDYRIIASPSSMLHAVHAGARRRGLEVLDLGLDLGTAATALAARHAAIARARRAVGWSGLIVSGGESTARVRGGGRGGRNTEYLLALFEALDGEPGISALAADTDGVDGRAGAAGAVFGPAERSRAAALGLQPLAHLGESDSAGFFATLGSLVVTGPTLTNVNDIRLIHLAPLG
jgi:hydroxypyruvate reductase